MLSSDVCIVGAGPAGITLFRELQRHRISVTLLESGDLATAAATEALARGRNVGLTYYPLHRARARYFGGSSNYWFSDVGVRCRRLDAADFEERSWIPYSGWPITRADLDPYYEEALPIMGLRPSSNADRDHQDDVGPALPLDSSHVRTEIFELGPTDTFRRYLRELATTRNGCLVLNANVFNVAALKSRTAVGHVDFYDGGGRVFRSAARAFVLAAGGLENPRLLLLSRSTHAGGIGNENDLVGRFFMEHPHFASGHVVPPTGMKVPIGAYRPHEAHGVRLMAALRITEERRAAKRIGAFTAFLEPSTALEASSKAVRSFRELWRMAKHRRVSRAALSEVESNARNVAERPNEVAAFLVHRALGKSAPDAVQLMSAVEQVPNPASRVTLSSELDRFGNNKLQLDWRLTADDFRTIELGQETLDSALRRAGLGRLHNRYRDERPAPSLSGGWHHMGTTRMHVNPRLGVVNADCRVHGIANLFIAGSSVFPTVGDANPTLTIVALAIRLAEHIRRLLPR